MSDIKRSMLVVPEKQGVINKLEKKYKEMSENPQAIKKKSLEVTGKVLKVAETSVGIITIIDWLVPDPVLGIDEIGLTALTATLASLKTVVNNKLKQLEATGDVDISMDEVKTVADQLKDAKNKIDISRQKYGKK